MQTAEPLLQLPLWDVRNALAQHGGDDVLEPVRLQLEFVTHHAPQVEHHAAHHVQVARVVAPCTPIVAHRRQCC